ncbi:hypothetical protein E2320_000208 [Naja naja]|nr:hypothetical protein E2320_000208 [Naja naja]
MHITPRHYMSAPKSRDTHVTWRYMTIVSLPTIKKAVLGLNKSYQKPQTVLLKDYQGNCIPVLGTATLIKRHDFHHRAQKEGETINDFVAALREVTAECQFRALEGAMQDGLVLGLKDLNLQRWLIIKPGLTFQAALDKAKQLILKYIGICNSEIKQHTQEWPLCTTRAWKDPMVLA